MLRRVFGPKSEEETGGHKRVHKELLKAYPTHVIDTRKKTYYVCPVCSMFGKYENFHIEVVIDL